MENTIHLVSRKFSYADSCFSGGANSFWIHTHSPWNYLLDINHHRYDMDVVRCLYYLVSRVIHEGLENISRKVMASVSKRPTNRKKENETLLVAHPDDWYKSRTPCDTCWHIHNSLFQYAFSISQFQWKNRNFSTGKARIYLSMVARRNCPYQFCI